MKGIYKITNSLGKIYIGQSVDLIKRQFDYKNHRNCKSQTKLSNSIKKYGWDSHKYEIIEECSDISTLNDKERYWQDFYNVIGNMGLNCRLTKSTDKSGKLSEETKNKIRDYNIGRVNSEETREKISVSKIGKTHTPEHKKKVSENHSRHNALLSDETVHTICMMYINGKTTKQVIEIFPNIHVCSLSEIRTKRRYKHITSHYNIIKNGKGTYTGSCNLV